MTLRNSPLAYLALAFSPLVSFALPATQESELQAHLQQRIDRELNQSIMIGIVSSQGEEYITAGTLSVENPEAPTKDTIYEIGGVTKVFTAAAAADLVQARQLTWKTAAASLLPAGKAPPILDGEGVNLHRLATNSTGLPPLPLDLKPADPTNPLADYDAEALYRDLPKTGYAFKPGTNYHYSELGYGLLGHLLELRTDQPYGEVIQEHITGPLGMEDTTVVLTEAQQARFAAPHDGLNETTVWDWNVLAGAGALKSSAADMLTFLKAQMGMSKTPKAKAFAVTHAPMLPTGAEDTMTGYAWQITSKGGTTIYWHNGMTGGSAAFIGFNPARRIGVVILTNSGLSVDEIGFYLLAPEVFPLGKFPPLIRLPDPTLQRYVGRYQLTPETEIDVTRDGSRMYAQITGGPTYRIYPISDTRFGFAKGGYTLNFKAAGKAAASAVLLEDKLRSVAAPRIRK